MVLPNLIYSARTASNAPVFADLMEMHVPRGATVADVTHGKGAFWRDIPEGTYDVRATDLLDGIDCRDLPYRDGEIDAVILDPPYMHTPGGTAHVEHQNFEAYYQNNACTEARRKDVRYHDAVLLLYMESINEAARVLRIGGVLVIKCQDEICAGQMRLTSAELTHYLVRRDWTMLDLFVVVRLNKPGISRLASAQKHSRRNHSYFLVVENKPPRKMSTRLDHWFWPDMP